ncbi:sporulation histidine kinase inhibitor Sda [Halobacillus locisalis]
MIVSNLNYQLLILSLHRARELELDHEFIRLLEQEISDREQEETFEKKKA